MSESSSNAPARSGRPPLKQRAIAESLRVQIVGGELTPGSQLPTRRDLVATFGGSLLTVQQALDQLVREGFIEVRGVSGTFVTRRPPHLHDYALVFAHSPEMPSFRRFWTALGNEAIRLNRRPDFQRRITVWHGIEAHPDNEDFQRLCSLVRRRQLAGVIFGTVPFAFENTPLMDESGIPRVAIATPDESLSRLTVVKLDMLSLVERAFEHLSAKRRRRVAVISAPGMGTDWHANLTKQIQRRRMMTRPYWNLSLHPSIGSEIRHIAHLLMHPGQAERPDALIITDDNLVEPVTAGLIDAGVRVPDDLEIVAHCNFPWPTPSVVPARRVGFDAAEVLNACLGAIQMEHDGQAFDRCITIHARFENDIPARKEVLL